MSTTKVRPPVQVVSYKPSTMRADVSRISGQSSSDFNNNKPSRKNNGIKKKKVDPIMQSKKTLEKLKHDVKQFSLQGFTIEERRNLERQRAMKLGAKPKKREFVNYKELMEQKKKAKLEWEEKSLTEPEPALAAKMNKKDSNKPATTVFWTSKLKTKTFGQVGNYKNGVLRLSKLDLKACKRS